MSVDVAGAQRYAREVTQRLSLVSDPDAAEAAHVLHELTEISDALQGASKIVESSAIMSRLLCISARCDGSLQHLGKLVNRAALGRS